MGYQRMTVEEWQTFLRSPVRPALVATARQDGSPHLVPVWYDVDDDGTLVFTTGAGTVKGRAIARDPRVALCVQDDKPPFSFVLVEGMAELSDDPDRVRYWAARLGARYMGADRAAEYGQRNAAPSERVVRVTPTRVTAVKDVAN